MIVQDIDLIGNRLTDTNQKLVKLLQYINKFDKNTFTHSIRVGKLSYRCGQHLGFDSEKLKRLYISALLHDIGKIYIPKSILLKPGRLNSNEFEKVKLHSILGKDLVLKYFDGEIYNIISQHHERLDGSGYPMGYNINKIPVESKIIAICDSYDAMITNRIYSFNKSHDAAIKEIADMCPLKYDSGILDVFIKSLQQVI